MRGLRVRGPPPLTCLSRADLARIHPGWFALLAGGGSHTMPPHLVHLSDRLAAANRGEAPRLMVSMPPQHGKSVMAAMFAAWFLGVNPDKRVIFASYQDTYAAEWGAAARDTLAEHGPGLFGVEPESGAAAGHWWVVDSRTGKRTGGAMHSCGARGSITGRRADLVIIDDPFKNMEEAFSPTIRRKVWQFWQAVARTRLAPGGIVVVIQTRWHEDDLCGRLLAQDKHRPAGPQWEVINLPALAEAGDPLGRAEGQALWEDRYDRETLLDTKFDVGDWVWAALYQGRPAPLEGGLFKRAWLRRYREAAPGLYLWSGGRGAALEELTLFATVDLATSTKELADYTVVMVFGLHRKSGALLVLDVERQRVEGPDIIPLIREVAAERWKCAVVYVEQQGFQLAMIQQARRAPAGERLPIRGVKRHKDKVARALPATADLEAGKVLLPESAPWLGDLEGEVLLFPEGKNDDQVDCLADGCAVMRRLPGGKRRARMSGTGGPDESSTPRRARKRRRRRGARMAS